MIKAEDVNLAMVLKPQDIVILLKLVASGKITGLTLLLLTSFL